VANVQDAPKTSCPPHHSPDPKRFKRFFLLIT
jgi:Eukaryotic aspartyl protease